MTFWERLGFAPAPATRVRHEHFCAEHDRRWPCYTEPCLLHLVAPCPDKAHP
jgi:hypothetical protein